MKMPRWLAALRGKTAGPDWVWRSIGDGSKPRPSIRSGAVWAWVLANKFFSAPALMALPGALLLGLYSTLAQSSPARVVFLLILAIFLGDLIAGFVFMPRAHIERTLPARVRAGNSFLVRYTVRNRRRMPAYDLELDPELGFQYFETLQRAAVTALPGRGTAEAGQRLLALRRGRYQVGGARIVSRFPLAISKWSWRGGRSGAMLAVYPEYTPLLTLELPTGRRFQNAGLNRVSKVAEAADFCGCRDFRDGDNPRHIHWQASARSGRLILKEFQEEYLSRAALIIDTGIGKKRKNGSPQLEAALSLAAAAAEYLMADECVVDLFAAGRTVVHFQAGRSLAPFEAVLDVLAGVEGDSRPELGLLSGEVFAEIAAIGSALVILLSLDAERLEFVAKLRAAGVAVKAVAVAEEAGVPPAGVTLLTPAEIAAGKVRML